MKFVLLCLLFVSLVLVHGKCEEGSERWSEPQHICCWIKKVKHVKMCLLYEFGHECIKDGVGNVIHFAEPGHVCCWKVKDKVKICQSSSMFFEEESHYEESRFRRV